MLLVTPLLEFLWWAEGGTAALAEDVLRGRTIMARRSKRRKFTARRVEDWKLIVGSDID